MASDNLKKEFEYYKSHQGELVKKYEGKYIVIKNQSVIGVYNSDVEAYQQSQKEHELGSFIIQYVSAGESNYSQTFYSRVSV